MIEVRFVKKEKYYQQLTISGHAMFADYGDDIICAGVSAIVFGGLNAFDLLIKNAKIKINNQTSKISISTINPDDNSQLLFDFLKIQLTTLNESYPNYIEIKEI